MVRFVKPEGMSRWDWLVSRFWEGVEVGSEDECWLWKKARVTDGYGTIAYKARVPYATHRLSYIIHNGELPQGMVVMHTCDNPPCCNPAHLKLGTNADNIRDRVLKKRGNTVLTDLDVVAIREDTRKQRDIARQYRITQSMVSRIKRGNRWKQAQP